jgi:hypothetical protein
LQAHNLFSHRCTASTGQNDAKRDDRL